jgi:hypothetical protein
LKNGFGHANGGKLTVGPRSAMIAHQ